MPKKKSVTTLRWIATGVLLAVAVGIFIAMLASGHEPSLHFIGSMVFTFIIVGLAVFVSIAKNKLNRVVMEQKAQAADLAARKDYAAAIRLWKELLPQVGQQHVDELLPELQLVYQEIGSAEGADMLSQLRTLYADFFEMTKRMKQLDARGRTMRQSLADKICETVSRLPES